MVFFDIQCAAKYRKQQSGDPSVESKKLFKKSNSAEKNPSEKHQKGESYVFEVVNVYVFVLDEILAFRVCSGRPYSKLIMLNK